MWVEAQSWGLAHCIAWMKQLTLSVHLNITGSSSDSVSLCLSAEHAV